MASVYVSPGVFTEENDLSFVPQGVDQIGGAVIGLTEKGPAFEPVKITQGFGEFRSVFGNLNTKMYAPYAAKNYLQNANNVSIVRVLSTQSSSDVGRPVILAFGSVAQPTGGTLSSTLTAMAVLRARSGVTLTTAAITGTSNNFALDVNGTTAGGLSLNKSDATYIGKLLGTDPFAAKSGDLFSSLVYVDSIFDYAYFSSAGVTGSALAPAAYATGTGGFSEGNTPVIVSQNYNGSVYDLFALQTISDGDAANTDIKISITMEQSQVTVSAFPVFTVSVRKYDDTDSRPVVLESFTCTLNPDDPSYIKRVIGDRTKTFNTTSDPPELVYDGDYQNNSRYIRVVMYDGYPADAKPSGFKAIPAMQAGPVFKVPYKKDALNFASVRDQKVYMGFDSTQQGAAYRLSFLNTSISATSSTVAKGLLIATLTAEYQNSGTATLASSYELVDATTATSASTNLYNYIKFTVPFYGGWDGWDQRKDKIQLLADGTLSADLYNAIKVLANPDEVDFNLLTIPGVFAGGPATQGSIPAKALDMVTERADAFYIMDIGDSTITTVTGAILNSTVDGVVNTAKSFDTNYAASYFPSVRILDIDNNKYVWVPASVAIMGAYAFNDKVGEPWYAPAGLNRGVLNVFEARKRLTQTQRDTLQLGRVNPIATLAGQGVVVYGQKTLQVNSSALDRVNVRRMLLYAKKLISSTARYFLFEPNNSKTRSDLVNAINPILENIQNKSGLNKFQVICDDTNNTPDVVDRNILVGDIYLEPTKTGEIFIINFNLTRTGASFSE